MISQTFSEFWSARASACFFNSDTFFWHCWQKPPFSSNSEMETDPAPSGGGRLLHRASSVEWSLFLGVTGESPLGHPSTWSIREKFWLTCWWHARVCWGEAVCLCLDNAWIQSTCPSAHYRMQVVRFTVWGEGETSSTSKSRTPFFFTLSHVLWDTYKHAVARVQSIRSWSAPQRAHSPRWRLQRQESVFVKQQIQRLCRWKTRSRAIGWTVDPTEGYQSSVRLSRTSSCWSKATGECAP